MRVQSIPHYAYSFLKANFTAASTLSDFNKGLKSVCGINSFFDTDADLSRLKEEVFFSEPLVSRHDKVEHGDFQTNDRLAGDVVTTLISHGIRPEVLIEPTCGKGAFILAAIKHIPSIEYVYAMEVYKPYIWEVKFSLLDYFLQNPGNNKPEINISHCNIFDVDFADIKRVARAKKILVLGNPPWVTNAKLGVLDSPNLPRKSNFKEHSGLDAITGKANFDIAEYILLMLINAFQSFDGWIALLVKNSVIRNIVHGQKKNNFSIGRLEKHLIDSKKEFDVSVDASLFFCRLNVESSFDCSEFDFYKKGIVKSRFGWVEDKFVSNVEQYIDVKDIDGVCPFEWRQGLKHDCAAVMELDKQGNRYVNSLKEEVTLEDDLVYGMLKSSDLKGLIITSARKYTIVTQRKIGQSTSYIGEHFPETYSYLVRNRSLLDGRKSSIYKGKPSFSIFGIGDYSFKPYKVAISGLYKTCHFTLVLPYEAKALMLDDTCYLLGFEDLHHAFFTFVLLNSPYAKRFLEAISFADAKRIFTKDILMRIDLYELAGTVPFEELECQANALHAQSGLSIDLSAYGEYLLSLRPAVTKHNR